jgi:hypothetical protein
MTVPYTFGTATTSIPLSNLDANFNTPITLGNTSIYLGNTTTTIGNLTLTNATISSGNIANITITNVSVTTANVTNITVSGTANIATGNVTTLTSASITDSGLTSGRVTFAGASGLLTDSANLTFVASTSTLTLSSSGSSSLAVVTAGTNVYGSVSFFNSTTNYGYDIGFGGSASIAPNSFYLYGGSTASIKLLVNSSGNVGINNANPITNLDVVNSSAPSTGIVTTLRLNHAGTSAGDGPRLLFTAGTSTTGGCAIGGAGTALNEADMIFYAGGNTERMRLTGSLLYTSSAINVAFGASTATERLHISNFSTSSNAIAQFTNGTTGTGAGNGLYVGVDTLNETTIFSFVNAAMKFGTNGAERMRITSAGVLDIGTGGGAIGQIQFPATQVPSANANTLDDYEEGTWTPVFIAATTNPTGVTYSLQVGRYTKIGKSVTVWGQVALTSKGTGGVGEVRITGLPFVSENVSGLFPRGVGDIGDATWTASRTQITYTTVPNDTYIAIIESGSGQGLSNPTWANQNNNTSYTFTITYPTST